MVPAGIKIAMTRLHTGLLISLLLHAAVFMFAGPAVLSLSEQKEHALYVQLVDRTHAVPAVTPAPALRVRHKISHLQHVPVMPATQQAPPADDAVHPSAAAPVTPAVGDTARDTVTTIEARLHADLARYFDYPALARLLGWEGRVMVAFDVESDGRLRKIHVARSSGFALLDSSALHSLRRVERIIEAADLLQGRRLAMQIPIIYRLQGDH